MAMPPGNTPPGIPGTHQPNQTNQLNQINPPNQLNQPSSVNQSNQTNQPSPINQPNQINQPNPQNEAFLQMSRNLASSPNLTQLNHPQPPPQSSILQPQSIHPQQKQPQPNMPASPISTSAAIAALMNLNPATLQNPNLTKIFQQLKKFNVMPNQPHNQNQLSQNLLRLQLQAQAQNANFQQQRPKQTLQHMNLQQLQASGGTISTSVSTPTLSSLSFGSVPSGGLISPTQNQAILTPRQQFNASKKQKESPKVEVNVTNQSLASCIASCGLSNSFLHEVDNFEVSNNVKINPKSLTTIAIALYTRMSQIVEQSVKNCHIRLSSNLYLNEHQNFYEKKKQIDAEENMTAQQKQQQYQLQQNMNEQFQKRALTILPGEPVFTDIPMANIAQIEVERRISELGITNYPEPPKGIDNTFDVFRNHALCGIAARLPENMREKVTSCTKEIPDNTQPDYASIARLGFVQTDKKLEVTFDDVYQVIENDAMFTPQKLQSSEFSLQIRKIRNLQEKQASKKETES